jgi:hypothetical protein
MFVKPTKSSPTTETLMPISLSVFTSLAIQEIQNYHHPILIKLNETIVPLVMPFVFIFALQLP